MKGAAAVMHTATLLRQKVKGLQAANATKKQRQQRHKKRIQEAGVLTVREGRDIIQTAAVEEQIRMETHKPQGAQRRRGRCNRVGHNARTCAKHQASSAE